MVRARRGDRDHCCSRDRHRKLGAARARRFHQPRQARIRPQSRAIRRGCRDRRTHADGSSGLRPHRTLHGGSYRHGHRGLALLALRDTGGSGDAARGGGNWDPVDSRAHRPRYPSRHDRDSGVERHRDSHSHRHLGRAHSGLWAGAQPGARFSRRAGDGLQLAARQRCAGLRPRVRLYTSAPWRRRRAGTGRPRSTPAARAGAATHRVSRHGVCVRDRRRSERGCSFASSRPAKWSCG